MASTRVLLIEDNPKDTLTVQMMLADVKGADFAVTVAKDLAKGLDALAKSPFDIVFLDLTLKDNKGLDALEKIQEKKPEIPVVILTGLENQKVAFEAVKKGAQDYVVKGKLDPNLLSRVAHYAIERHRKNQELERLSAIKSEFVSTVSHELRTPLTIILSASNNFLEGAFGKLTDDQTTWITKVRDHALHLTGMIGDILDLSKLQSGKAKIEMAPADVARVFAKTVGNLQMLAAPKKMALSYTAPSDLSIVVMAEMQIERVLTNLITNAIKFGHEGGRIDVSVKEQNGFLRVVVEDNGPGVAPENRDLIFERFRQLRSKDGARGASEGIGLGLAICKEIIEKHHGRIWVESELGKGSRFCFEIPMNGRQERKAA